MSVNMDIAPNCHLGHLMFEHLKKNLDSVCQIDAATGEKESYASVLKRSVQLARAFRTFGLKPGDVVAVGGRNHLDICIPSYAALFNGLPIVGVDPYFKYDEVRLLFNITRPKIVFCQNESYEVYSKAITDIGLDVKLVTFDGEFTMSTFMEKYETPESGVDFQIAEIDPEKVYCFLISSSGTTGKVKVAAFKHAPFLIKMKWLETQIGLSKLNKIITLNLSPVHWISNCFNLLFGPIIGDIRVQTSIPDNFDHVIDIINKYKPTSTLISPSMMLNLLNRKDEVDLTCFKSISITGSKVYTDIFAAFKTCLAENCFLMEPYGLTEMVGFVLLMNPFGPIGSCGIPMDMYRVKLVDPDSGLEIKEPNVVGELWVKGPGFSEYYNDPEETAKAFTKDGYMKTGDLLYHDEKYNYYFVERIKALIKYKNSHVLPGELEEIIKTHPGVKEVCVVGINHPEDGERPVACVVKEKGHNVTEQEIKDLVASKLSQKKYLHGGVLFVDSLQYTSTGKLARTKIRQTANALVAPSSINDIARPNRPLPRA